MFGHRAREHGAHGAGGLDQTLRPRPGMKGHEPRHEMGQKREVIVRLRRALECDPQQRRDIAGKSMRQDSVAFDDPGVAIGGALAGAAAVDQGNRQPAFGEVKRNRRADNAGAQYERIGTSHELPSYFFSFTGNPRLISVARSGLSKFGASRIAALNRVSTNAIAKSRLAAVFGQLTPVQVFTS